MASNVFDRVKKAWHTFLDPVPSSEPVIAQTTTYGRRPDKQQMRYGNRNTIITPIYNRIAVDVAALKINHVKVDGEDRFREVVKDSLNDCLTLSANVDQTGRALIQDCVMSMLDEGVVALVPVETMSDLEGGPRKIESIRAGKIVAWQPRHIMVDLYDDRKGSHQVIRVPKASTVIVENPFYSVMNESNSILSRLKRKLALIDIMDEKNASAKLDMIIQVPFAVKNDMQMERAKKRIDGIEKQLNESAYGIAYADATERITQLNRPLENNLLKHVEYLTTMLYSQLGISEAIMSGTADEKEMLNYNNRTIEPIVSAIVDEMQRKWLTKTARTQGHAIKVFNDPFKLVPLDNIAEIADKFTRNEIATSNEIRQAIGWKPADDPKADQLRNSNISAPAEEAVPQDPMADPMAEEEYYEETEEEV